MILSSLGSCKQEGRLSRSRPSKSQVCGQAYSASATWVSPIRRAICFTFIFCS
jgi:hypothetical protein